MPLVPVALLLLGLIMLGGDMGTAIILTAILFGLLWLAGAPTRLFAGVLAVAALLGALLIKTSPQPDGPARLHRRHRPRPERPVLAGGARDLRARLRRLVRFGARRERGEMGPTP